VKDATTFTTEEALANVEVAALSPRIKAIAGTLGAMLSEGYSKAEIARFYGKSRPWVSARLGELEDALREQIAASRTTGL